MDNKVFYGLLAAIAVVFGALYVVLVMPEQEAAAKAQAQLKRHEKAAKAYARKAANELPTDALRAAVEKELEATGEAVQEMREYFASRDEKFERLIGGDDPTPGQWRTAYADLFTALENEYWAHEEKVKPLEVDDDGAIVEEKNKKLPFTRQKEGDISREDQLPGAQKHWNVNEAIVRGVIDNGGWLRKVVIRKQAAASARGARAGRTSRSSKDAPPRDDFIPIPVDVEAYLPPGKVNDYLSGLLTHERVNFELDHLELTKQMSELQLAQVVKKNVSDPEAEDEHPNAAGKEPMVGVVLNLEVLDYNYVPPPPAEEEGDE